MRCLKITDRFVRAEHPSSDPPVSVRLDDTETSLLPDYSSIWGRGLANQHDEPFRMLQAFQTYFEKLKDETQIREIVETIVSTQRHALIWRTLLSIGTRQPATVGRAIRSLAWDHSILTERDTTQLAGTFLTAIFPMLTPKERARVEESILNIPQTVQAEKVDVANRFRDRLFGCLDASLLTTPEAQAHEITLRAAGGPPLNRTEPRFEFGAVPFTQEDFLRDRGVPVDDPEHERILSLVKPLQAFTIEFLNEGPPTERVKTTLPAVRALEAEMPAILKLHSELAQQAVGALLQAADAVLRSKAYVWDNATIDFFKALLLRYVADPSPKSND
jgi:phage baseplate assembly protein W